MFSAFLPNASSNLKLGQNGTSKPSSRFSVRVFKTPSNAPFPYPINPPKVDPGYRPNPPREQPNPNLYSSNNAYLSYDQRPRATTNYAIYPSANNGIFIYEQSTCSKSDLFSNSELDSPTTDGFSSPFSPAMSTDSTITLPRTIVGDRSVEDLRLTRAMTPALRSGYPPIGTTPSQAAAMARTASSGHHIHEAPQDQRSRLGILQGRSTTPTTTPMRVPTGPIDPITQMATSYMDLPEYAASTLSELEVNQRDMIAKRNAELNSTPTASLYASSTGSSNDNDRRRMPSMSQNSISPTRDAFTRVTSSQPMRFPTGPPESDYSPSSFRPNAPVSSAPFPSSRENSPPRVERLPSQVPQEQPTAQSGTQSTYSYASSVPVDARSREAALDSEYARMSYRTSPKNSAQPFDGASQQPPTRSAPGAYAPPAQQDTATLNDHRQDRAAPTAPMERSRSRRISILGPRPDISASRPLSEISRDYGTAPRAVPERSMDPNRSTGIYNDRRGDIANSPPRGPTDQASSRDISGRAASGADFRRDSRTPSPRDRDLDDSRAPRASRRDSYTAEHSRSAHDPRNMSQPLDPREYIKSAPLSSSPTELEPASSRYPSQGRTFNPPPTTERAPMDRVRVRSISFSNSTRPPAITIPINTQMLPPSQPYPTPLDSRHTSDYNRTSPPRVDAMRATNPAEFDRRGDSRTSPPQGTYHSQPPMPDYHNQASQRPAVPISMSTSRAMDRTPSNVQVPHSRMPPPQQEPPRSRTYPDLSYVQPHTEPVRRHSDGENPYDRTIHLPRINVPYEKPPPILKVMNPSAPSPAMSPVEQVFSDHPRRNSDGDQTPPLRLPLNGRSSAPLLRCVRWTENLVCPSPIPTTQRRKGWFNRRGDQLWTNDGAYKAAPAGQEYPPDLDEYPESGEGWMNEECIRIDLTHRLIPKAPLRSALKQASARN